MRRDELPHVPSKSHECCIRTNYRSPKEHGRTWRKNPILESRHRNDSRSTRFNRTNATSCTSSAQRSNDGLARATTTNEPNGRRHGGHGRMSEEQEQIDILKELISEVR